jgi:hypothetical protein
MSDSRVDYLLEETCWRFQGSIPLSGVLVGRTVLCIHLVLHVPNHLVLDWQHRDCCA